MAEESSPSSLTLLDFWPSPYGIRVRLALSLKDIPYTYKEEDLQNKSQLLLNSNPIHQQIPVLIHNNKPISESLIIIQYIDETWPDNPPKLMPDDPYERARARFWAVYVDKNVYELGRRVCLSHEGSHEERERARGELCECLKVLEGVLGEREYFGGVGLGLVDVCLVPFYAWFYAYERLGELEMEGVCPKLVAWGRRCVGEERVGRVVPGQDRVYELIVEMINKKLRFDQ
ncbi:hypothetical protein Syun_008767 [Stephania yunnanensis]|uniref:glutathione transferase n=1 Tax=Stephania yunnanensis TaxID=152371 RepID=A0AAP0PMV8_9MAGN